ncbi:MAG: enoyl-CoA hydratase-related protein [Halioglobus sp.]
MLFPLHRHRDPESAGTAQSHLRPVDGGRRAGADPGQLPTRCLADAAAVRATAEATFAAVNGAALGAGCDLACMCDIRIAAASAPGAD